METISVVLSSYNGEMYILEQLESIKNQTMPIDEVIICDDCSTDNTFLIIKDFISKNELEKWTLKKNKTNIGWQKNFMSLINEAKGSYIFTADQDDIWMNYKIKEMVEIMKTNQRIDLLCSNYIPYYEKGAQKINKELLKDEKSSDILEKYTVDHNFLHVKRPGCTYCIRKKFFDEVKNNWRNVDTHDGFLSREANLRGGLYLYKKNTIKFRRHANNTSTRKRNKETRLEDINFFLELLEVYESRKDIKEEQKVILKKIKKFQILRYKFFYEQKLYLWLILYFFFKKYYPNKRGIFGELLIFLRKI